MKTLAVQKISLAVKIRPVQMKYPKMKQENTSDSLKAFANNE